MTPAEVLLEFAHASAALKRALDGTDSSEVRAAIVDAGTAVAFAVGKLVVGEARKRRASTQPEADS